jgi:hypothetical protein
LVERLNVVVGVVVAAAAYCFLLLQAWKYTILFAPWMV